jgi:enamine deaminase RidA (YjgF/YER057c/UK114 family)
VTTQARGVGDGRSIEVSISVGSWGERRVWTPAARATRSMPPLSLVMHATIRRRRSLPAEGHDLAEQLATPKRVVGGHVLYSHVVVVEGKKTIFVSGQLARGPAGDVVVRATCAQLRQVGENIKAAMAAAGATLADIVKTNTYVTDSTLMARSRL